MWFSRTLVSSVCVVLLGLADAGCESTDPKYKAKCAAIHVKNSCDAQIVCKWSGAKTKDCCDGNCECACQDNCYDCSTNCCPSIGPKCPSSSFEELLFT